MDNINNSFFDGHYKEIWKTIFPEKTTLFEVDFLSTLIQHKKHWILDLMCGNGRHSLELAKRGYSVTAIDNLDYYIEEINSKAVSLGVQIDTRTQSALEMKLEREYNLALIMGNSFQFFDQSQLIILLKRVSNHMPTGGMLVINSWMILEIAAKSFQPTYHSKILEYDMSVSSRWCFSPTRIETDCTIVDAQGEKEEKEGIDFIYSLNEIETILGNAGFIIDQLYSIPGKKKFEFGDPRIYIVAKKA